MRLCYLARCTVSNGSHRAARRTLGVPPSNFQDNNTQFRGGSLYERPMTACVATRASGRLSPSA
jgi:hypothetical protein